MSAPDSAGGVDPRSGAEPGRGFIALLGATSGLSAFGMASVVPALPPLSRALDADLAAAQWIVSAYLLGLAVFQPLQGLLCDRFGRRPVLIGGIGLFLAASLLGGLAQSLDSLVAARFLQAMGVSVATVVTRAVVTDRYAPEPAAVALSFITAVMGVAPVIAPVVGGYATDLFGWRGIFWMHAAVAALLVVMLSLRLRESRPAATRALTFRDLLRGARVLVADRRFLGQTLVYAALSAAGFVFITAGAALFESLFGMSSRDFGLLWSTLAIAYVSGAALAGRLSGRLGAARAERLGMACALAGALAFAVAAFLPDPDPLPFVLALLLLMAANGFVSPIALTRAVAGHPSLAGVASGLSSAIAMLLSMVSTVATGLLYDGTAHGLAVQMAIVCVVGWMALGMAERAGRDASARALP